MIANSRIVPSYIYTVYVLSKFFMYVVKTYKKKISLNNIRSLISSRGKEFLIIT